MDKLLFIERSEITKDPKFRRIPGLCCEKCGSDKFELSASSDGAEWIVQLSCKKCPRIFEICHVKHFSDISPLEEDNDG